MANQLPHHIHQDRPSRRATDLRIPAIEKYAYCLCLHVKPTTICIAVFKLFRALLFASLILNTELSINEQVNEYSLTPLEERHRSTSIALLVLARVITAAVSAVGIYAVISGRAALLMPLYATLLVDFFFTLPTFYHVDSPIPDGLPEYGNQKYGGNQYNRHSRMLLWTIIMIVRVYFLCVVWKCYRYLRLIELVTPIGLSEIYPHIHQGSSQYPIVRILSSQDAMDLETGNNVAPPPYDSLASNMKPPNYDEAMKSTSGVLQVSPTSLGGAQQQTVISTDADSQQQQQPQPPVSPQICTPGAQALVGAKDGDGTGEPQISATSPVDNCPFVSNPSSVPAEWPAGTVATQTQQDNRMIKNQAETQQQDGGISTQDNSNRKVS